VLLLLSALLSVLLQFDSIAADEIDFETLSSLPPEVRIDFANSPLAKRYQLSAHINPFYLHRDGDGQQDTAILLKKRATGKTASRSIVAKRIGWSSSAPAVTGATVATTFRG
jgi:hypothetical protein